MSQEYSSEDGLSSQKVQKQAQLRFEKAPEDWRTPRPAGIAEALQNARKRRGVRQSSGAFGNSKDCNNSQN
jgi:hypothetical protein